MATIRTRTASRAVRCHHPTTSHPALLPLTYKKKPPPGRERTKLNNPIEQPPLQEGKTQNRLLCPLLYIYPMDIAHHSLERRRVGSLTSFFLYRFKGISHQFSHETLTTLLCGSILIFLIKIRLRQNHLCSYIFLYRVRPHSKL